MGGEGAFLQALEEYRDAVAAVEYWYEHGGYRDVNLEDARRDERDARQKLTRLYNRA